LKRSIFVEFNERLIERSKRLIESQRKLNERRRINESSRKKLKKIEISAARILSKKSKKNSFFENDYSIQKKNLENESLNEKSVIEIHFIAIVSFNILSRQKNVKIFVVFMKNLKTQFKRQDNNKIIDLK
jgi:hypothetical protein